MAERTRKKLKVLKHENLLKTRQCSLRNSLVSSREELVEELKELLEESSTVGVFVINPEEYCISHTYEKRWMEKLLDDLLEQILKGMLVVLLSTDNTEYCFTKVENIYITSTC